MTKKLEDITKKFKSENLIAEFNKEQDDYNRNLGSLLSTPKVAQAL